MISKLNLYNHISENKSPCPIRLLRDEPVMTFRTICLFILFLFFTKLSDLELFKILFSVVC